MWASGKMKPFWKKGDGKVEPAKTTASMSSSMLSLSPSQLNAAIMDMLNVNNNGSQCQNACRGSYNNTPYCFHVKLSPSKTVFFPR